MQYPDIELRSILLGLAREAIEAALGTADTDPARPHHPQLDERRAAFVTLTAAGRLRGCLGILEADNSLAAVVRECAVGAALRDPRFTPVSGPELDTICISISILSEPTPLRVVDRDDLVAQLRPHVDGLVVQAGVQRATLLPQVWEQLPDPSVFVDQLLYKAGLAADDWPPDIRFQRYASASFSEPPSRNPGP